MNNTEQLQQLLIQSECRIDRTNDMVCKLVSVVDTLTREYAEQITKLQQARDALIQQNQSLITLYESRNKEFEILNKKYDMLIEKMCHLSKAENNINVN